MKLPEDAGATLCALARHAIEAGLRDGSPGQAPLAHLDAALLSPGASFVTLRCRGALRGCIGSLEARGPLAADVHANAWAAAFRDPRFPPLRAEEYPEIGLHLSALSPLTAVTHRGDADLLQRLRPGVDGLLIRDGHHQATFLPAVWQQLPDPPGFLAALKRKGGFPPDATAYAAWRYTCTEFDCP